MTSKLATLVISPMSVTMKQYWPASAFTEMARPAYTDVTTE